MTIVLAACCAVGFFLGLIAWLFKASIVVALLIYIVVSLALFLGCLILNAKSTKSGDGVDG